MCPVRSGCRAEIVITCSIDRQVALNRALVPKNQRILTWLLLASHMTRVLVRMSGNSRGKTGQEARLERDDIAMGTQLRALISRVWPGHRVKVAMVQRSMRGISISGGDGNGR